MNIKIPFLLTLGLSACQLTVKPDQPNIIVILADDMGYSDIGCFGGEIATPNLDILAENGLKFTQFYNAARCCPTRASLLTGLYPHMAGMGWMTGIDMQEPGYPGDLNNECVTIAEVLNTAGYGSYASGKWHVSENVHYDFPKHNWPLQRGFEKYYGIIPGAANYFEPVGLTYGNDQVFAHDGYYLTDALSDSAVGFIEQHLRERGDSPFFLCYESYRRPWANASNTPFRLYKSYVHEGGISTPCVVSWPDGINNKGRVIDIPTHVIDLMPTFMEITRAKYPEVYNGINIAPLPGKSLVEIFQNKGFTDRPIFWEHEANRAVRWGQWKIVSRGMPQPPYEGPWELYDMSVDRLETNDLALSHPEKLSEMEQMWIEWAKDNRVFPLNGTNIPTRFRIFGRKEHGFHRN